MQMTMAVMAVEEVMMSAQVSQNRSLMRFLTMPLAQLKAFLKSA